MKKRIQLLNNISSVIYNELPGERYEVGKDVEDPNGIIVRSADCLNMEFNKSLLGIARAGVGYNNIPIDRCTENGVVVFNTPGANANAVKELVLASAIMASRNVFEATAWAQTLKGQEGVTKTIEAEKKRFVGPEIKGKTLGVIGLGAIGAMVANDALSLGMDVIGYDPFITIEAAWSLKKEVRRAVSLEQLVAQSDIITIHVPLSDKTRDTINEEVLAKTKKGAILLNFARGGLVNNEALKDALKKGIISKYVVDFPDEEVIGVEGIIAVPHLGASTPESEENCAKMAAEQLYDFLQTGNIKNSVNMPACALPPHQGERITFVHQNVPNIVSQITTILAKENNNITSMNNRSRDKIAYTLIDLEGTVTPEAVKELEAIPEIVRLRIIKSAY